jgi:hypothetical protein
VAEDFETYAEREYLGAVCRVDEDVDIQLAGVRYVATRVVAEQESCLRELLDMQSVDRTRREVDAGCVDALLVTTDDALDTGRFLAHAASHRKTRTTGYKLVEDAMRRLGNTGNAALLAELARPDRDPAEIRKLTRILVRVSRIAPPESVGTLVRCTARQRAEIVEAWAREIHAAGGLPADEPTEPKPPES